MKRITSILSLVMIFCLLLSVGAWASGEPSGEPSGEASGEASGEPSGEAGTYTDGVSTLVIAGDGTFTMETVGENMDGGEFVLTVIGTVTDGVFTITGVFDGDMDLTQLASADQLAENLATVEALANG